MEKIFLKNINELNIDIKSDYIFKYISKYTNEKNIEVSSKAWSYLISIFKQQFNIDISNNEILLNEYNKPYIKNLNYFFNISHSKNLVAIIISDKECGIDIEYINKNYNQDIIYKVLSQNEIKYYNSCKNKINYFYSMWTKKEAYFKKIGMGINYKLLKEENDLSQVESKLIIDNDDEYILSYIS